MLQKTCTRCTHYNDGCCKLYRFYPQSSISTASACDQFTTVKTTKQSCVNCVHYRDKRCFLHNFDVEDPEYSATICAEFTPINTQKTEKETLDMSEKSCLNCELYYSKGTSYCDAHNIVVNLDKNQHLTFAKECPDYTLKATQTCKNCVHYRDKRCFLHNFDIKDPKYSASLCVEFTPINTQKTEMNKFEKALQEITEEKEERLQMIADDLYKLDNQQVSSEDLTPINTSQKSCETCEHGKIDQLHFLTCAAGIQDTFNEEDQYIFDEGFANECAQYEPETIQQDPVNPNHYTQGKIECIDAIESALTPEEFRGFLKGNVFKYMWRHENKNGLQDVKKGEWYYQRLLKVLKDKDETD